MQKVILLCLLVSIGFAQKPFFTDPVISGTPLVPTPEEYNQYLIDLKKTDFKKYSHLTKTSTIPENVGDEYNFNVFNFQSNPPSPESKTFVLKIVEVDIRIWVEKAEFGIHITDQILENIRIGLVESTPSSSHNEAKGIFDITTDIFGKPPDVDGNDKVEFLLTDIHDDWDGTGGYIGGYFSSSDQVNSNQKADILYVDTYPGIYTDNSGGGSHNVSGALGTISHEIQHLIHYAYDTREDEWVNEGLSELASYLCGYGLRSPALYLQNTGISLTSWSDEDPLPHYSKAALWTYFLYEKYGLDFITSYTQNSGAGIVGINNTLGAYGSNMAEASDWFFKTLSINDPDISSIYVFEWEALQHLPLLPAIRIIDYPSQSKRLSNILPYSLQSLVFTNGDSLNIFFTNPFSRPLYSSRLGYGRKVLLDELFSNEIYEAEFGKDYHTYILSFINNSGIGDNIEIEFEAEKKFTMQTISYDLGDIKYNLTSDSSTNAIQYVSNRDSSLLKSVEIYNYSQNQDIKIHLYKWNLTNGATAPESQTLTFNNIATSGWIRFDVEDILCFKDSTELFNVGVEFLNEGVMGYCEPEGLDHIGRSFVKNSLTDENFFRLGGFSVDGQTLTGSWMIRLEVAKKISPGDTTSNPKEPDAETDSLVIAPNPYIASQGNSIFFQYFINGNKNISLNIFNMLGQLVYSAKPPDNESIFRWNGNNQQGQRVSSGLYVIRISSPKKSVQKKFVLIR